MARIALDAMGGDHAPSETVAGAIASGVDVVLVGDEAQLAPLVGDAGIPIVHAGTTTSSRGRGKEAGRNSLNVIRVEDRGIEISVYLYSEASERFLPDVSHRYPRRPQ